jgi:hypothetical protein
VTGLARLTRRAQCLLSQVDSDEAGIPVPDLPSLDVETQCLAVQISGCQCSASGWLAAPDQNTRSDSHAALLLQVCVVGSLRLTDGSMIVFLFAKGHLKPVGLR